MTRPKCLGVQLLQRNICQATTIRAASIWRREGLPVQYMAPAGNSYHSDEVLPLTIFDDVYLGPSVICR